MPDPDPPLVLVFAVLTAPAKPARTPLESLHFAAALAVGLTPNSSRGSSP